MPTWIIKKLPGTMAPIIADIINRSIALSASPASIKEAWVTPILKETVIGPRELKKNSILSLTFLFLPKPLRRRFYNQFVKTSQLTYLLFNSSHHCSTYTCSWPPTAPEFSPSPRCDCDRSQLNLCHRFLKLSLLIDSICFHLFTLML